VRLAKLRWCVEQNYQQLKEELGLDHYEGRGWQGWHHHVTLVCLAYAFLLLERQRLKKNVTPRGELSCSELFDQDVRRMGQSIENIPTLFASG
jgi:SRSO17 transposase